MSTKKLKLTPKTTEVAEPQNSIIKFLKVDTNKKDNKICEQIMSKRQAGKKPRLAGKNPRSQAGKNPP